MTTKNVKSKSVRRLEHILGEPLTLALLLRSIREGEEWSLADMGKKIGVTRGHVAAVENGKSVSPEAAARYAKKLGYSAEQFVRLAMQDQLSRAGLRYHISLKPIAA